jgi:dTDP-glucose 4,6-dehydratase
VSQPSPNVDVELGTCLVTGAAGFIGSHLVEELSALGANVRALVRYTSSGTRGWLDELDERHTTHVEFVLGDVRDPDQMRRLVDGCDTVFHLAALIGIPYSYESPRQNLETNAIGTLNLLEGARLAGVRRFVQISSSVVYGTAQYVPIDELHPIVGQSPYSASKIAADQTTISYVRSFDLPAVIVRPFNTFGPRQSRRAVIPTIITQALFSDRIRIGATDTSCDFTFVRDTARGMIAAARADGIEGGVFNLGHGKEITIGDLVELIQRLAQTDLPVESEAARRRPAASEVDRLCSDPRRAREAFGWRPAWSLRDGLSETIEWLRSRGAREGVREFVR